MSKIEDALYRLHEALKEVRKDDLFLNKLENALEIYNKLLYKGNMITTEGVNFGKSLLQNDEFVEIQEIIHGLISFSYSTNQITTLEFDAKVAEFISNNHYALLASSASPEKERLSQLALNDYNLAINSIISSNQMLKFYSEEGPSELSEEAAKVASQTLIPLLHLRGRIFSGAYDPDLRNDEKFNQDIEWIKELDSDCVKVLNRPPHLSLAIIERTLLQNIARYSTDLKELEACLNLIDEYNSKYQRVYREDGLEKDWVTDPFNISVAEEIKGRCLLKLEKFQESYDAFENMEKYAEEAGSVVRAGWAEFFMAQVAKGSQDQSILNGSGPNNLPNHLESNSHILNLLEKAKEKESKSGTKTWARDQIENMIQVTIKEENKRGLLEPELTFNQPRETIVHEFNKSKETSTSVFPSQVDSIDNEKKSPLPLK